VPQSEPPPRDCAPRTADLKAAVRNVVAKRREGASIVSAVQQLTFEAQHCTHGLTHLLRRLECRICT
jgi:hypothetical protein